MDLTKVIYAVFLQFLGLYFKEAQGWTGFFCSIVDVCWPLHVLLNLKA
jgi:hypothetical protein